MDLLRHHCIAARANRLANRRLHLAIGRLTAEDFHAPRTGFFPSLALTLNHLLAVDGYYLDALEGVADMVARHDAFAPAATLVVWSMLDLIRNGKATAVGAATGIVVGLVAITPAAGFVSPVGSLVLGAVAAFPSYFGLLWRARTRLDDSLDVVAAHGVGGTVGALLTGVLATKVWNGTADGLLYGNPRQLGVQALGALAAIVFSGVMTFVILKVLALFGPLRVDARDEGLGLDVTQHGEEAYARGEGAILVLPDAPAAAPATRLQPERGRA